MVKTTKSSLVTSFIPGHPRFFNQLSCGLDLISMAGEWLTATANTNMFTYEIAPVFILMENVVMTHMREIIGSNWVKGDSILAPGESSLSNDFASRPNRFVITVQFINTTSMLPLFYKF
jgi:glutamate decarboxylase